MIDVKKLITGFLMLATAATCSGLILSVVINSISNSTTADATAGPIINGVAANTAATNAFAVNADNMNQATVAIAPALASSTMFVSSTDPANLTDALATAFVNNVVSTNPTGPTQIDADGNPTFTPPDVNTLAAEIANSTTTQNLQIPNWDIEAASIPVTVVANAGTDQLAQYGMAVNDVLNNHLDSRVQSIAANQDATASTDDLTYLQTQINGALKDITSLKTPASAVAYQKSLVANLVYEKNFISLNNLAQTDPVKASILFQSEDQKFTAIQQKLLDAGQAIALESASLRPVASKKPTNMFLSFVDNTFSIPQAQALLPVFDPATWGLIESNQAVNVANEIKAIVKNTLLQILKNTLIALIQRKVLSWVQGSGAPRFITNWGTTLVNAAQQSAINAIDNQINSGCSVYPAFAPQIKVTLKAFYTPASGSACANLFAASLGANTFQQFYNNFSNGGFIAFGASTLPSGNLSASQFFAAQKTDLSYSNQQAASNLKATTGGGYTGDQYCPVDHSDPVNGQHVMCESSTNDYNAGAVNGGNAPSCKAGYNQVIYDNAGLCANGDQPLTGTPAAVTGLALGSAVDATPKQISAANDIVGLLNSVLSSLLNSLASFAVNAAGKVVNNTLSPSAPNSVQSGTITGAGAAPASQQLACSPTTQTVPSSAATAGLGGVAATSSFPVTFSASGGTTDTSGNTPTYSWTDSTGAISLGSTYSAIFPNPGTYTITVRDSAGNAGVDAPANCTVTVQ